MPVIIKPCPRCKCNACYPLHRRGLDWAISLLGLRPARCLTCMKKFYTRYKLQSSPASPKAATPASSPIHPESRSQESPERPHAA